jgi:hypothetical protein
MADINVERKSSGGRNFLPWILGLLLLAALLWGLSRMFGGDREEETNAVPVESTTTTTTETPGDPAATGTMMPTDTTGMSAGAAMPMDTGAAGMGGQVTGARDSAGGDNVPEGATGNP